MKVKMMNGQKKRKEKKVEEHKKTFVKEGEQNLKKEVDEDPLKLLQRANDWSSDFDLPCAKRKNVYSMDQRVCATEFKPDGFIVSYEEKICIVIELTCPMEENMDKWHKEKMKKYLQALTSEVYTMKYVVVEVGARGGMTTDMRNLFKKIGFTKTEAAAIVDECRMMAEKSSFVIWCQRFNEDFVATEMLL